LVPLLLLQHSNISGGELVLVNLVVLHLFNGKGIVPLLRQLLRLYRMNLLENEFKMKLLTFFFFIFLGGLGTGYLP
jgi:hypothetical protein